jgi:hypothetical protein
MWAIAWVDAEKADYPLVVLLAAEGSSSSRRGMRAVATLGAEAR